MALYPISYCWFNYYYCEKCGRGLKIWDDTDEEFGDRTCECSGSYVYHGRGSCEGVVIRDPYPAEALH